VNELLPAFDDTTVTSFTEVKFPGPDAATGKVQEQFWRADKSPDQRAPRVGAFTEMLPHELMYLRK